MPQTFVLFHVEMLVWFRGEHPIGLALQTKRKKKVIPLNIAFLVYPLDVAKL